MKSILVPADTSEAMASVLATARLLAERTKGHVCGVALKPIHVEIVAPDPIVAVTFPPADWDDAEFSAKARRSFEEGFAGFGSGAEGPSFRWRAGASLDDATVGSLGRVFDITVLGRPTASGAGPRMTTVEAALFESGRPILLAPPKAPRAFGEVIAVSWNCSTEQARATAAAMPLLRAARSVHVIHVEGLSVPGPSAAQCVENLTANGVKAQELSLPNKGRKPSEVLLAECARLGVDFLVKGAYTQSRLRQMIFGGATSHLLAHADIPMLMAH